MQIIRNICFLNTTLGVSFNKQLPEKVKREDLVGLNDKPMKISLYNTKKVYMHSISYRIGQDPSYKHCQKPTDERFVYISTTVDAFSSVEHEIP